MTRRETAGGSVLLLVIVLSAPLVVGYASTPALALEVPSEPAVLGSGMGPQPLSHIGNEWTAMSPAPRPQARNGPAMAYDGESDRTVLFGGHLGSMIRSDETWVYDLEADNWTEMNPPLAPQPTAFVSMAYDSGSDQTVLFGGYAGVDRSETWAYDVEANTWVDRNPATRPSSRDGHGMAYDSESDRIVLFGGWNRAGYADSNETWAYDYETNQWTNMNPPVAPPARHYVGMAYDAGSDLVVLFGGYVGGPIATRLGDTWTYDLNTNTWAEVTPATSPSPRGEHNMAYDVQSDLVVLFGVSAETWIYDTEANTWQRMTPASSPSARQAFGFAYDTQSDRVVLFGGWTLSPFVANAETWVYDAPPYEPMNPVNLTAVAGDGQVALSWQPPTWDGGEPLAGYSLYRGTTSGGETFLAAVGNVTLYADLAVTNGQTYYYQVTAVNAVGESLPSNEVSATPLGVPGAPRNLTAIPGAGQVTLTWESPGFPVLNYTIYRGLSLGGEVYLVTLGDVLIYLDTGLVNGQTYFYRVTATNGTGEGPPSNEAWATPATIPGPPRNLVASAGAAQIALSWQPPTDDGGSAVTNYTIYRGLAPGTAIYLVRIGNSLVYVDGGVGPGQTYYYQVTAVNDQGEGPPSNETSAYVDAPPTAAFLLSPTSGSLLTNFSVDASPSSDLEDPPSALEVRWDWEDDGAWDSAWSTTRTAAHRYAALGSYVVRLEVRDTFGSSATATEALWVNNTAPIAAFLVAPIVGGLTTAFTVDASPSSDLEDPVSAIEVRWDWEDDGAWDTAWSTTPVAQHLYSSLGDHTIRLEVRDTASLAATLTQTVEVIDDTSPTVSFTSPADGSVLASGTVVVTGTASDAGGSGLERVDVRLNGGPWRTAAGAGSWNLSLNLTAGVNLLEAQAWDNAGNPSPLVARNLTFDGVRPAVTECAVSPSPAEVGGTVTVSAAATDLGAGIRSYTIVLRRDGATVRLFDPSNGTEITIVDEPGDYEAVCTAADRAGLVSEPTTASFRVNARPIGNPWVSQWVPLVAILVAGVALGLILFLVLRRRKRRAEPPPVDDAPPPSEESPPPPPPPP
ncbi:MAG TPA: kelch repeat-containing protein [Thermoplasmata archaeon]|nr:kelch repeat-containing protein [Thermoplasmata archaeon]